MTKNYVTELTRVTNVALRMLSVPPLPCCCHDNQHMYYRPELNPLFLALIQGQPQKNYEFTFDDFYQAMFI